MIPYQYTRDRNDNYRKANLNEGPLAGLKINIMYIFDEHSRLVWGMVYDLEGEQEVGIEGLEQQLSAIRLSEPTSTGGGYLSSRSISRKGVSKAP